MKTRSKIRTSRSWQEDRYLAYFFKCVTSFHSGCIVPSCPIELFPKDWCEWVHPSFPSGCVRGKCCAARARWSRSVPTPESLPLTFSPAKHHHHCNTITNIAALRGTTQGRLTTKTRGIITVLILALPFSLFPTHPSIYANSNCFPILFLPIPILPSLHFILPSVPSLPHPRPLKTSTP